MKRKIAERWIAALRSAEYRQATGRLYDGKGYCCLGVLCRVLGYEFDRNDNEGGGFFVADEDSVLPAIVMTDAGMNTVSGEATVGYDNEGKEELIELTDLNDSGKSFTEIANVIEKHWKQL